MDEDYDLFEGDEEHGAARHTDPETSHDAAESLSTPHLESVVVATLREARSGLTTHEIAHRCGISWGTITPRMKPLRIKELVYDTGQRRDWYGSPGNPPSSRMSIVWQLTAFRDPPNENENPLSGEPSGTDHAHEATYAR